MKIVIVILGLNCISTAYSVLSVFLATKISVELGSVNLTFPKSYFKMFLKSDAGRQFRREITANMAANLSPGSASAAAGERCFIQQHCCGSEAACIVPSA